MISHAKLVWGLVLLIFGAAQALENGDCPTTTKVDIVLIVDGSGSVEEVFQKELELALDVVQDLPVGPDQARIALIQFSSRAETIADFDDDLDSVVDTVKALEWLGDSTNAADAFRHASVLFAGASARPDAARVLFIVTDGHSQNDLLELQRVLYGLHDQGVLIFTGTESPRPSIPELELYAGNLDRIYTGTATTGNPTAELKAELQKLISEGAPVTECVKEEEIVDVDGPRPSMKTTAAPATTYAPLCEVTNEIDMVVILDASGSVESVYEEEKRLVGETVQDLQFGLDGTRVALIRFAADAETLSTFSDNRDEVMETIEKSSWRGGMTNVADSFRQAAAQFSSPNARPNAAKVVFIVTDGWSQNELNELADSLQPLRDMGVQVLAGTESEKPSIKELEIYTRDPEKVYLQPTVAVKFENPSVEKLKSDLRDITQEGIALNCDPDQETRTRGPEPTEPSVFTGTTEPGSVTEEPTEPGTEPPIETVEPIRPEDCPNEVDLVVIVDGSGSVKEVFENQLSIALDIIGGLPITLGQTHISLIEYAAQPETIHNFIHSREEAVNKLGALPHLGGSTNIAGAFRSAQELFQDPSARPSAAKVVLVITDGHSQNELQDLKDSLEPLHDSGVIILAATDSSGPSFIELEIYTRDRLKIYVHDTGDNEELEDSRNPGISDLKDELTRLTELGGTCVPLSTTPDPDRITTPGVPVVPDCNPADIVFVLDSSGSVTDDYTIQVGFIQSVVSYLNLEADVHRVALIAFSGLKREVEINFDDFDDQDELIAAIGALKHYQGTTRTGEALTLAETVLAERRSGVETLVIIVSDGYSQDDVAPPAEVIRNLDGVTVYTVGVTRPVNRLELEIMAGDVERTFLGADTSLLLNSLASFVSCGKTIPPVVTEAVIDPPDITKTQPPVTEPPVTTTETGEPVTTGPEGETPGPEPETPAPEGETTEPEPETPGPEGETTEPEPETPGPEGETTEPEPETPGPEGTTEPEPETPGPEGTTEPEPETPGPEGTTEPEPETPGPEGTTEPEPETPGPEGTTEPEPETPGPEGETTEPEPETPGPEGTTEPETPGPEGTREPEPETPGPEGTTEPEPETPGPEGTTEPEPETPGPEGGTTEPEPETPGPEPETEEPEPETPPPPIANCIVDLMLIFDSSGSVVQAFQNELKLGERLVSALPVQAEKVTVGAVYFSGAGNSKVAFKLNEYDNKDQVLEAIRNIDFIGGTTATGDALKLATSEIVSGKTQPVQVALVFTDGLSQQDPAAGARQLQNVAAVYAVSQGTYADVSQLELITGDMNRVFRAQSPRELEDFVNAFKTQIGC